MRNVVFLTIDTLRRDVLGCGGGTAGVTPFIDSLQNKCIRFAGAQSCSPYTQASYPAILTLCRERSIRCESSMSF